MARIRSTGAGGDDSLFGNGGNDTLNGGLGVDRTSGGSGDDTFVVNDAGDVTVEAANSGIDAVRATISFTLAANIENLALLGAADLTGTGNELANALIGNDGDNLLIGNDRLTSRAGTDELIGGNGNDTFDFNAVADSAPGSLRDGIADFHAAQGDRIDLFSIDAVTGNSGNQAFDFIGGDAFSEMAGELRFNTANGVLSGDVNGDGLADFQLRLANVASLAEASIIP